MATRTTAIATIVAFAIAIPGARCVGYGGLRAETPPRHRYSGAYGSYGSYGSAAEAGACAPEPCLASDAVDAACGPSPAPVWYDGARVSAARAWCSCSDPVSATPVAGRESACVVTGGERDCAAACAPDEDPLRLDDDDPRVVYEWASTTLAAEPCESRSDGPGRACGASRTDETVPLLAVCRRVVRSEDGATLVTRPFVPPEEALALGALGGRNRCDPETYARYAPRVACGDPPECVEPPREVAATSGCEDGTRATATLCIAGSAIAYDADLCDPPVVEVVSCGARPDRAPASSEAAASAAAPATELARVVRAGPCARASSGDGCSGARDARLEPCSPSEVGCAPLPTGFALGDAIAEACVIEDCVSAEGPAPGDDDVDLTCASGVVDVRGTCCASADSGLDACGLCPDAAYDGVDAVRVGLDAGGSCCSGAVDGSVVLTGALACCALADVDVCGVCAGGGRSCRLAVGAPPGEAPGRVAASLRAALGRNVTIGRVAPLPSTRDASTRWRRLVAEDADAGVDADGMIVEPGHTTVTANAVALAVRDATTSDLAGSADDRDLVVRVRPVAVPSNGACELGETYATASECFHVARPCPRADGPGTSGAFVGNPAIECGGNGACSRAANSCVCAFGYAGRACENCAPGFRAFTGVSTGRGAVCAPELVPDLATGLARRFGLGEKVAIAVGAAAAVLCATAFNGPGRRLARRVLGAPSSAGGRGDAA